MISLCQINLGENFGGIDFLLGTLSSYALRGQDWHIFKASRKRCLAVSPGGTAVEKRADRGTVDRRGAPTVSGWREACQGCRGSGRGRPAALVVGACLQCGWFSSRGHCSGAMKFRQRRPSRRGIWRWVRPRAEKGREKLDEWPN